MISYYYKIKEKFNVVSTYIAYNMPSQMKRRLCYEDETYEKDYGTFA